MQEPGELPAEWLSVGHIDEMFLFSGQGSEAVVASSQLAELLLVQQRNLLSDDEWGRLVFFAKGAQPVAGVIQADSEDDTIVHLKPEHQQPGLPWQYIRIYRNRPVDPGDPNSVPSDAAGQIAKLAWDAVSQQYRVDIVWDTTSKIVPRAPNDDPPLPASAYTWMTERRAPLASGWFGRPQAGDRYVLLEDTQFWRPSIAPNPTPAAITADEMLEDQDFIKLNNDLADSHLSAALAALQFHAGLGGVTATFAPVLYAAVVPNGNSIANRTAIAFTPGLANLQEAAGTIVFPEQFGMRNMANQDVFQQRASQSVPGAVFANDWDYYHRFFGEIHCASYVRRQIPSAPWWESMP